jgi:hypothetical protein
MSPPKSAPVCPPDITFILLFPILLIYYISSNSWSLYSTSLSISPQSRAQHSAVYNSNNNYTIIFGGTTDLAYGPWLNDTSKLLIGYSTWLFDSGVTPAYASSVAVAAQQTIAELANVVNRLEKVYSQSFDNTTTSPLQLILTPVYGSYVSKILIQINTAASGPGASVSVGQEGNGGTVDRYVKTSEIDLTKEATYVKDLWIQAFGGTQAGGAIDLYITAGGQTFNGVISIWLTSITAPGS